MRYSCRESISKVDGTRSNNNVQAFVVHGICCWGGVITLKWKKTFCGLEIYGWEHAFWNGSPLVNQQKSLDLALIVLQLLHCKNNHLVPLKTFPLASGRKVKNKFLPSQKGGCRSRLHMIYLFLFHFRQAFSGLTETIIELAILIKEQKSTHKTLLLLLNDSLSPHKVWI